MPQMCGKSPQLPLFRSCVGIYGDHVGSAYQPASLQFGVSPSPLVSRECAASRAHSRDIRKSNPVPREAGALFCGSIFTRILK